MAQTSTHFAQLFRTIVIAGNYTRAAQQMGVTPAAVSKAVARQESVLGVQLVQRTTRSMRLTEAGRRYYEECVRALEILEAAEQAISDARDAPEGLVRVSVPTTYGHSRVLPWIPSFLDRFPRVRLDIDVSNANVDLVSERFDFAIRMGDSRDSSMVARKLEDAAFGVFASPAYVEAHGAPAEPAQLARHRCITFVRPSTGRALPWFFVDRHKRAFEIAPAESLRCSGDVLGCLSLARAGAGLVQTYRFLVEDDLRRGVLIEVLEPFAGRSNRFSLLRPAQTRQTLAMRTFADELSAHCAALMNRDTTMTIKSRIRPQTSKR